MTSDLYLYDSDLQFLPCDGFFPGITDYYSAAAAIDNFHQQTSIDPLFPPDSINLLSASSTLPQTIQTDSPRGFQDSAACGGLLDAQEGMSPFFGSHSYSGGDEDNVAKYMQRSYSINSFEEKPALFHNPPFMESLSPDFQNQLLNSPENCSFFGGQIRRVCSTGDLQGSPSCPAAASAAEGSFMDEANLKVGRYSAEERRERILKYRAKRNQRNFSKTIKYACRKTLADNRPRIRGRFARNDEIGDVTKAAGSNRDDDDDEFLWGVLEEDYGPGAGPFCSNSYGSQQGQYRFY